MASDVVQFRQNQTVLERLRASGINPNELARDAFEEKVRSLTIAQKIAFLEEASKKAEQRRKELGITETFDEFWIKVKKERDER